jgi:hypothetical protein
VHPLAVIRSAVAGLILLSFFGSWLAMEWTGRQPDTLVLLGAVAVAIGAGYQLWGDAMSEGVDAVDELQTAGEDNGENNGDT